MCIRDSIIPNTLLECIAKNIINIVCKVITKILSFSKLFIFFPISVFSVDASPVHKATVVPRGSALGYVMQLPEKDELSWSKKQLLAKMDVCMGGRVAEEMIFGEDSITTGMVIISLTPLA